MDKFRRHFDRLDAWLIATSCVAAIAIALSHCSDGSTCGNGIQESGEACDKGPANGVENSGCSTSCTIAPLNVAGLEVMVTRLKDEAPGYTGAGCSELGASQQHIVIAGPMSQDVTIECSKNTYLLQDVPTGEYSATVTLLDSGGQPITKAIASTNATAIKGQTVSLDVNFKPGDFLKQDYTGTLFFKPAWGTSSAGCTMASPAVTGYGVSLKDKNGMAVMGMTTGNHNLDGTSGPCFVPDITGTAEAIANLPWGHYELTLAGYASATIAYCKTFDVFAGPGTATPTYDLLVTGADVDAGACP